MGAGELSIWSEARSIESKSEWRALNAGSEKWIAAAVTRRMGSSAVN